MGNHNDSKNTCDGQTVLVMIRSLQDVHQVIHDDHVQQIGTIRESTEWNPYFTGEDFVHYTAVLVVAGEDDPSDGARPDEAVCC